MNIEELKASGLLELYVIGALSGAELAEVEALIENNRESVQEDLLTIARALEYYAQKHAIIPDERVKIQLLAAIERYKIENKSLSVVSSSEKEDKLKTEHKQVQQLKGKTETNFWQRYAPLAAAAMLVICLGLVYLWMNTNTTNQALKQRLAAIEQVNQQLTGELEKMSGLYASLTNPNNDIVAVTATEKYPTTAIYFYHNPVDRKNYMQLKNLPEIDNTQQSFQLWSIKGENAPTPLDVFQKDGETIVEVQHIDDTNVYAITIENKGGAQTPNLTDLIGTFAIKS